MWARDRIQKWYASDCDGQLVDVLGSLVAKPRDTVKLAHVVLPMHEDRVQVEAHLLVPGAVLDQLDGYPERQPRERFDVLHSCCWVAHDSRQCLEA
eukprot:2776578-Rhodomonas_salina.1